MLCTKARSATLNITKMHQGIPHLFSTVATPLLKWKL